MPPAKAAGLSEQERQRERLGRAKSTTATQQQLPNSTNGDRHNGMTTAKKKREDHSFLMERPRLIKVLRLIYSSRYQTAKEIHRVYAGQVSFTTIKDYLLKLNTHGYVKTQTRQHRTEELVYSINRRGVLFLRDFDNKDYPYTRDEAISSIVLPHEVGLTRLHNDIRLAAKHYAHVAVPLMDRRYFRHPFTARLVDPVTGQTKTITLIPDLGFLLRLANGFQLWHFLEFDRGTEDPEGKFKPKLEAYDLCVPPQYLLTIYRDNGATDPKPAYRRLVVVQHSPAKDPDDFSRLVKLVTQVFELPEATRSNLYFATADDAAACRNLPSEPPLSRAIWYPVKFMRGHQAAYTELMAELKRSRKGTKKLSKKQLSQHRYDFVRRILPKVTKQTLFPPPPETVMKKEAMRSPQHVR